MALARSSREFDTGDSLDSLASQVSGDIVRAGDERYDALRVTQITSFDRYPEGIVRARNANDVAESIRYARENHLPLSLRSGGHSVAGHSTNTGGIVIDMGEMNAIDIDVERRVARIQPGAKAGEITAAAQAHGLILPLGDASSVGISGLTLGGGIGWLVRKYGLTIDSLLSVQLVTADGDLITASEEEHSDLFWAVRGGGGNFGVITEFEFALHPLGEVYGGALVFPATADAITKSIELARTATNDVSIIGYVVHAPPLPFLREEDHGRLVLVLSAVYAGDMDKAEEVFAPFRAITEPLADVLGPMPYAGMYELTAAATIPHRVAIRMTFADELDTSTCETIVEHMQDAMSPMSMFQFRVMGGAYAEVAPDATAFAHRDREVFLAFIGIWQESGEDAEQRRWMMDMWNSVRDTGSGVYSNFLEDEGEARVRAAYPSGAYQRLADVKRQYDPENVFRLNQNIRPSVR